MGSLRELLDKQKREKDAKANAAIKPVLQSQPKQETPKSETLQGNATLSKESPGTGEQKSISENEPISSGSGNGNTNNPVVEQRPPAGLTGIALIKWKREHANSLHPKPSSPTNMVGDLAKEKEISAVQVGKVLEQNKSQNEIQKIPAVPEKNSVEKTNPGTVDGVIDTSELRRNLEYLANNIEQKELVGQIVRTIAKQLKDSPELCSFMLEADVDLMVRGLRRSYSVVAKKKSETKEAKEKGKKGSAELSQAFKDAGLDSLDIFK